MGVSGRKYSKINFEQIVSDLQSILRAKEGPISDLGDASYGKTLIELFAGNADLLSTWVEAAFQDSFLETASSPEAIYLGARSIGYSVRRAVPAKAGYGISLKRTGVYPTVRVSIPKGSQFSISGITLTSADDCEFLYDRNNDTFENGLLQLVSGRAVLLEGNFVSVDFFSDGTKNQEFLIPDINFADYFGYGDPNYTEPDDYIQRATRFTTVTTDASLTDNFPISDTINDKIYWRISRRGYQDPSEPNTINDITNFVDGDNKTTNYSVLIDTSNDGRARLNFSDGINAAIPYGRISVRYFSTNGENGNLLNVAGSTLITSSSNVLITQEDGTESDLTLADLNIALTTDIRSGLNIESVESIRQNAPQIYNSLDSLNNRNSYRAFLKRYSDVKYANAYGEDVLTRVNSTVQGVPVPNIKYSNIVRYSALKDLYRDKDGTYYPTDPFEYYVDGFKVNGLVYAWQYDWQTLPTKTDISKLSLQTDKIENKMNTDGITVLDSSGNSIPVNNFIRDYVNPYDLQTPLVPNTVFSANLTPNDFIEVGSELEQIQRALNMRGYITLGSGQHMYIPPTVHDFTTNMDVILFRGNNFSDIKIRIKNAIYEYLRENTQFSYPIFRSKLESIVQKFPEVAGLNLSLVAKSNDYESLDLNKLTWLGDDTSQYINQSGLSNSIDVVLTYDHLYETSTGIQEKTAGVSIPITITNQTVGTSSISALIKTYYTTYIAYRNADGTYTPKNNLTSSDLTKFTAYIWSVVMNELYNPLFDAYKNEYNNGNAIDANGIYNVIEAVKGWYINGSVLDFKDTDTIVNLSEDQSNNLLNYFIYGIEYIKLVRNILSPKIARNLIDAGGNISNYSDENEIVQFNIDVNDIKVQVEDDSLRKFKIDTK